jgi:hypothetical protein
MFLLVLLHSLFRNPLLNFTFPFTTSYFPRHFRDIESQLTRSHELEHGIKHFLPFLLRCSCLLAFQAVQCLHYLSNSGHKHGLPNTIKHSPSEVNISSAGEEILLIL